VSYLDDPDPELQDELDAVGDEPPSDAETLLSHAIDVVAQAKAMPLSSSVLVSRDELLGLLEEARATLPEELKRARWTLADLDALTEQRRAHAERLVAEAEERGRGIIHEAEDFCDQRLAQMEIVLDRLQKTVQSGRARLRPRIEPEERPEDEDDVPFFDQDTV